MREPNRNFDPPTVFERHAYDEPYWNRVVPPRLSFLDSLRAAVCSELGERWVVDLVGERAYVARRTDLESHRITVEQRRAPIELHPVGPRRPFRITSFAPYAPIIEAVQVVVDFPDKTRPRRSSLAKFLRPGSEFHNAAVAFYLIGKGDDRGLAVHLSPFSQDRRPIPPEEQAELPTIDSSRRLILRAAWATWVLADITTPRAKRRGADDGS